MALLSLIASSLYHSSGAPCVSGLIVTSPIRQSLHRWHLHDIIYTGVGSLIITICTLAFSTAPSSWYQSFGCSACIAAASYHSFGPRCPYHHIVHHCTLPPSQQPRPLRQPSLQACSDMPHHLPCTAFTHPSCHPAQIIVYCMDPYHHLRHPSMLPFHPGALHSSQYFVFVLALCALPFFQHTSRLLSITVFRPFTMLSNYPDCQNPLQRSAPIPTRLPSSYWLYATYPR
jgi:hypothetical protein